VFLFKDNLEGVSLVLKNYSRAKCDQRNFQLL